MAYEKHKRNQGDIDSDIRHQQNERTRRQGYLQNPRLRISKTFRIEHKFTPTRLHRQKKARHYAGSNGNAESRNSIRQIFRRTECAIAKLRILVAKGFKIVSVAGADNFSEGNIPMNDFPTNTILTHLRPRATGNKRQHNNRPQQILQHKLKREPP